MVPVSWEAREDASWFISFLSVFNGVTTMKGQTADDVVEVDLCLESVGGGGESYKVSGSTPLSSPSTSPTWVCPYRALNA